MRTPMIAGNWKMHKTVEEALDFLAALKSPLPESVDAVLCAPYPALFSLVQAVKGTTIRIGAQNMHWEEKGAYTGEVSPGMLNAIGVDYVIIGHSERRLYFAETDATVNKKVKAALEHQLMPIVCVGETLDERESGQMKNVLQQQVMATLSDLRPEEVKRLTVAYEPVWAIGTGRAATADDAVEGIRWIRQAVASQYGEQAATAIRILYGGSVNPENIGSFLAHAVIDGALVGGASLDPHRFEQLIFAAAKRDAS